MSESKFQAFIIKELEKLFPGCIILKNDANYIQGFPDLLILYRDRWAALEVKSSANSERQVNQKYYIDYLNDLSYAEFIYPENKEEVLNEIQRAFRSNRSTRLFRG